MFVLWEHSQPNPVWLFALIAVQAHFNPILDKLRAPIAVWERTLDSHIWCRVSIVHLVHMLQSLDSRSALVVKLDTSTHCPTCQCVNNACLALSHRYLAKPCVLSVSRALSQPLQAWYARPASLEDS
jgi:hypothetical protein